MEIEYLKKLDETSELNTFVTKGISLEGIVSLEDKYNNGELFPKAFREYLFIGGEQEGTFTVSDDWEMLREDFQESLEGNNFTLDRSVFVFDMEDGGNVFLFFYLDEDKEDPDVYLFLSGNYLAGTPSYIKSANGHTFSGLINEAIRRIKNGLPF